MRDRISRRSALGLSAGVLAGAMITEVKPSADAAASVTPEALLAPLAVGSRFARWTVAAIHPIEHGALSVLVRAQDGHEFSLEVLARDASHLAPRPRPRSASSRFTCATPATAGCPRPRSRASPR